MARRAQKRQATAPAIRPITVPQWPVDHSGKGYCKPFLLRNTLARGLKGSSIVGSSSVMAKYHMNNCSSKGTLRVTSTCTVQRPRTSMLLDRRPMPIRVPSTVASTMPTSATRKVLDRPTK